MAFTVITGATDLFKVSLLNEIVQGLQERVTVSTGASPATVAADDDIQDKDFWVTLQTLVETICTSFYDSSVGAGGYEDATSISPFTESYFFNTVLGMTEAGYWRRATAYDPVGGDDWTTYGDAMFGTTGSHNGGYGKMQTGDIIGPWILDDLIKALKKLLWTKLTLANTTRNTFWQGATGTYLCSTAVTSAKGFFNFYGSSWVDGGHGYVVLGALVENNPTDWNAWSLRSAITEVTAAAAPVGMTAKVDCYEKFTDFDAGLGSFLDIDSLGITVAAGHYSYLISEMDYDDSGTLTRTGGELGYLTSGSDEPLTKLSIVCSVPDGHTIALTDANITWIAKWDFTNVS